MFSNSFSVSTDPRLSAAQCWLFLPENCLPSVVILAFFTLVALELRSIRGRGITATLRRSYRTNIATLLCNDTLMSLLSVSTLLAIAERHNQHGILNDIRNPAGRLLLALLLFDLLLYLWHRASHRYAWLWRFHQVHHSDLSMNVTTAFRLHFVEVLLTTLLKAAFIVATGVETAVVAVTEAIVTSFVLFHHGNFSIGGERWFGHVIVLPAFHRVHHSTERGEQDSNYGAVFSFWDTLFRTHCARQPKRIGLAYVGELGLVELIRLGFTRPATGKASASVTTPADQVLRPRIAETAVYKAAMRVFKTGFGVIVWPNAEHKIKRLNGHSLDKCPRL